ncbi:hypothetical protein A0V01_05450 (plasmid) [Borrelia hermsii]|uniref:Uncharacterized protein n=2 Tax=Borrelia hermsii TaxID=140 RepID=A0AAN0X7B2_BORHE|nr:hypothetical protein [Borrelia hermsii]AMR76056.1 hypothetical protein A0V01_05450 [Borrelia hermsii]UPA08377.1 hypothetical protein bhDAH_001118 [Borrelia hermsii DAH]
MVFAHMHKDIILNHLKELPKENLTDIRIIGDFDKDIEKTTFNCTALEKFGILPKLSEHNKITVMSHVINKANISYINNKNSRKMLSTKTFSSNPKARQSKFKRDGLETRLISKHKIGKRYLNQIKECSNNNALAATICASSQHH